MVSEILKKKRLSEPKYRTKEKFETVSNERFQGHTVGMGKRVRKRGESFIARCVVPPDSKLWDMLEKPRIGKSCKKKTKRKW